MSTAKNLFCFLERKKLFTSNFLCFADLCTLLTHHLLARTFRCYISLAHWENKLILLKLLLSGLLPSCLSRKSSKRVKKEGKESPAKFSLVLEHPFCNSDISSPSTPISIANSRYNINGETIQNKPKPKSRRTPMILSYALCPTSIIDYIERPLIEAALMRAFECYSQVIPIFFLKVPDYPDADVKVCFSSEDEDEYYKKFAQSGKGKVIAHAVWKQDGRIHLNKMIRWSVDFKKEKSKKAVDLESAFVHEIGHVLGLSHSSSKDAVMYPYQDYRTTNGVLKEDDIKRLQAIYTNFNNIHKADWKILTVDAHFSLADQLAGGGFILWDGARKPISAQAFPLSCGSIASARFEACCYGLNFLKLQNLEKVLVLINCIVVRQTHTGEALELREWLVRTLRFTGDAFKLSEWLLHQATNVKFKNRYREGLVATAELAKSGKRTKLTCHSEKDLLPPVLALLNREARMLRHLPLDAF